jgi:putative membrane protein
LTATCAATSSNAALAHGTDPGGELAAWPWIAFTAVALLLSAWLYGRGLRRLWARAGSGAGIPRWRLAAFAVGWLWAALALLSPLDRWGEELFAAHMVQHEILMLVAAPLLVLGRPAVVFLWAFPRDGRRRIGRLFGGSLWLAMWRPWIHPLGAWSTYAFVLWVWHAPVLFEAAIVSDAVHALQHISFFGAALLFWWAFIDGRQSRSSGGIALIAIFTTAVHSALLGALLTFAPSPWYVPYLQTTGNWGLTPLEDQQLGGLIMWVPAGLVHVAAGLLVAARWIGQEDCRTTRAKAVPDFAGADRR